MAETTLVFAKPGSRRKKKTDTTKPKKHINQANYRMYRKIEAMIKDYETRMKKLERDADKDTSLGSFARGGIAAYDHVIVDMLQMINQ